MSRDIQAELREATARFEASEASMRAIIEHNADGIVIVDPEGTICFVNPAAAALFASAERDLLGSPFGYPLVTGAFSEIDVFRGRERPRAIAEMRAASILWQGRPSHLCSLRDVTARKQAEEVLRRREEQLLRMQRFETVVRLAGEVAHSVNNVLMGVIGCSEVALDELAPEAPARDLLQEIIQAAGKGTALTQKLRALIRSRARSPSVLDLDEVTRGILPLLQRIIGDDIELRAELGGGLFAVEADRDEIELVLMNLVLNAIEAMPEGGVITVETRNVVVSARREGGGASAEPGEYALLAVRDTGAGMSADTRAHLFEPFFTTKDERVGLGLSTVRALVEESGGAVDIESAVERGTTFLIYLPRVPARASRLPVAPAPAPAPAPTAAGLDTVLLVDDEEVIRKALARELATRGYQVLTAGSGAEALEIAHGHQGTIHAVVTDLRMGEMSGSALVRKLMAERPEVRVIFMTADAGGKGARERLEVASAALLDKPFPPALLGDTLAQILGREPPAAPVIASARATILVVEDEPATRIALKRLLESDGHEVLLAEDAERALALYRGRDAAIDLLLTDVSLANQSGVELSRALQAIGPSTRVIFMSGHSRSTLASRYHLPADATVLEKPIDFDDLERKVEHVLAAR